MDITLKGVIGVSFNDFIGYINAIGLEADVKLSVYPEYICGVGI